MTPLPPPHRRIVRPRSMGGRGPRRLALFLVGVLGISSLGAGAAGAYPRPTKTRKVAVTNGGEHGNYSALSPDVSGNGRYVAFTTRANNLGPQDTNPLDDVYVLDRVTGEFDLVSVASDGSAGKSYSVAPAISADGRYVAFQSKAWNFTPGFNGNFLSPLQVYVHDRQTGETTLVSRSHAPVELVGNSNSMRVVISGDGRYVAFESEATNLVPGDANGRRDVFVFDRVEGKTELASVASDGRQGTHHAYDPALSFDGRYVGFSSGLENEDQTRDFQVFLRDRSTGVTEMVSVNDRGERGSRGSGSPQISADGRYVAFESAAVNLVPNDNNDNFNYSPFPNYDIFVRDRLENRTERVSVNDSGTEGNSWSQGPDMSSDGRFIVFDSRSSNLSAQHTDGSFQIYLHDRLTGITEHVSVGDDGTRPPLSAAGAPTVSDDGRVIGYETDAAFDPDDGGDHDSYVRDRGAPLGVNRIDHESSAGSVTFTGDATFSGAVIAEGRDPESDGDAEAEGLGAELTGAEVRYRVEDESIALRWRLTDLHEARHGLWDSKQPESTGQPGVMYGAALSIGGVPYEVRAARYATTGGDPLPQPFFALFRCDPACGVVERLEGGLGSGGQQVDTSVPLAALGGPGQDVTDVRFFAARGDVLAGAGQLLDEVALEDGALPSPRVEAGVAPAGSSPGDVSYAAVESSGANFSGTIDTSALEAGAHDLWIRACLGESCSARRVGFEVEADPDPDPTEDPTEDPDPDPTPTEDPDPDPTPTEDPEPGSASVSLRASDARIDYRAVFRLEGTLVADAACLEPGAVTIEKRVAGRNGWRPLARPATDSDGTFSISRRSRRSAHYRAVVAPTSTCAAARSARESVKVGAGIELRRSGACTVKGRIRPNHPGSRVVLERRRAGEWLRVGAGKVDERSRFSFRRSSCHGAFRVVWSGGHPENIRTVRTFRFKT